MGLSTSKYLTREAAAEYFTARGFDVKPATLAMWASVGRYSLPLVKIGKLVRYDPRDLDAFIKKHKICPGGRP